MLAMISAKQKKDLQVSVGESVGNRPSHTLLVRYIGGNFLRIVWHNVLKF